MKKALQFIFSIMLLLLAFNAFSQDTIVEMDGQKIQAKVLKVTPNKVDYKLFINPDGPVYEVNKSEIKYIKYQNGTTDIFTTNVIGNHALKLEVLSPLLGDITLGYEQKISSDIDGEIKIGFIYGASPNADISGPNGNNFSPQGAFFKAGLKLILPQGFNNLQGFYVKPEFIYSAYSGAITNYNYYTTINSTVKSTSVGADFVFGYQHIFSDRILLDSYFGWGLVATNINNGNSQNQFLYSNTFPTYGFKSIDDNTQGGSDSRVLTFGVLFGYVF